MHNEADQTAFKPEDFALAYPPGIEHHFWTLARNRIIAHQLRSDSAPPGKILEIGCGRGIVVQYLRARGFDCWGIESAAVAPIDSVTPWIFPGREPGELPGDLRESFTTLLLLDVLEHIADPEMFLRDLLATFPRANRLIVTVPARSELWSNYDEFYRHLRRYALADVTRLVTAIGAAVVYAGYFFHLLYWPARVFIARGGRRPVRIRAPGSVTRSLHAALAAYFFLEQELVAGTVAGTSIICHAQLPSAL